MKTNIFNTLFLLLFLLSITLHGQSNHPQLVLTKDDVVKIKSSIGSNHLFDNSLDKAIKFVDAAISNQIDVPLPKDAGGGYTHERHKQNYNEMYQAGILFQITGDEKYAQFIKAMLDEYAVLYPKLGKHPEGKKQTPGRMFWQSLNETVWLLHTIQAYDNIYNWLSKSERENYEQNIFNPMVDFFMNDCKHEFNLIHNHGTWIVAAVGMTGYVLDNDDYVKKSLYGSDLSGESGFLAQLDKLFSPDGYYTEGGYYVRYALWPFFIFAEAIHNNQTDLEIYEYRDQILKKALYSALQVTYTNGAFIPINDALKEKTWLTRELIFASNFVYAHYEQDKQLLSLVKLHDEVSLTGPGLLAARDLQEIEAPPHFEWKSVEFTDGPNGDMGGVGILRFGSPDDQETHLMKYGSHGLSHGHFDKLSFLFYDQAREIIQDYGAARFLNVVQKFGGRYLPENDSYAKQTVAHNTVVVNMQSQFKGKRSDSQKHHSERYIFSADDKDFQYVSAVENNAYKGVKMHRTMALVNDELLMRPVIVDIYKVDSDKNNTYDMPFYYMGQFISSNFEYNPFTTQRTIMGNDNGYQHLWKEAEAELKSTSQVTWLNGERFYTLTSNTDKGDEFFFTRIGASDPNYNLRNDAGLMIRKRGGNKIFASILEPHGRFNPILEYTKNSHSTFTDIKVLHSDDNYVVVNIIGGDKIDWIMAVSLTDAAEDKSHSMNINEKEINWVGPVAIIK
jgi:oligo-alginate lyase